MEKRNNGEENNDTCGEEKSDNDTCGEEKSNNDSCGEEKSNNDSCGEKKSDSDTCEEERNITDEQQTEADSDPEDLWEQTLEQSKENAIDVDILQKQADDITCNKVSHLTKEQLQQKASKDPKGLLKTTTLQENTTDTENKTGHDKINILLFDDDQEEGVSCATESFVTEERSQREASEDTGHEVQMSETFKDTAVDCQTHIDVNIVQEQFCFSQKENVSYVMNSLTAEEPSEIECDEEQSISQEEIEILQNSGSDYEPSGPDSKVSPSPDLVFLSELPSPSHIESNVSDCLELDSACCSALNPISADVGIRETISHSLPFDSCEESSPFSSSTNELLPDWTPDIFIPPHGGGGVFFDLTHQYPKSLWDAVNRIRKHTAPDSENEEEEVSEHWDPESIREGMGFPDAVFNMNSETVAKQDPCCTEQSVEEDTLSCSSHSSGDTVIVTEEDEVQAIQLDQVFAGADGEGSCSGEVNDETAAEEEREDEPVKTDMRELCVSEETSVEDMKINSVGEDTGCDC
nr:clumping factor A [Solea senegalensis]